MTFSNAGMSVICEPSGYGSLLRCVSEESLRRLALPRMDACRVPAQERAVNILVICQFVRVVCQIDGTWRYLSNHLPELLPREDGADRVGSPSSVDDCDGESGGYIVHCGVTPLPHSDSTITLVSSSTPNVSLGRTQR